MARASACEGIASGCLLGLWLYEKPLAGLAGHPPAVLVVLLLCACAFELSAHAWRLLMYLEIVTIYRNPFEPDRFRGLYPFFVLVVSATATAIVGSASGIIGPHSDIHHAESAGLQVLFLAFVYVPFGLFAVVGFVLHSAVRLLVAGVLRTAARGGVAPSISFLARQRVMRHGTAYLVLHGSQLALALLVLLLARFELRGTAYATLSWHAISLFICGRPAITLVGWLIINDVLYLCCGVCSLTKCCRPAAFLPGATADGGTLLRTAERGGKGGSEASASELRAQTLQGIEEVGFKEVSATLAHMHMPMPMPMTHSTFHMNHTHDTFHMHMPMPMRTPCRRSCASSCCTTSRSVSASSPKRR